MITARIYQVNGIGWIVHQMLNGTQSLKNITVETLREAFKIKDIWEKEII